MFGKVDTTETIKGHPKRIEKDSQRNDIDAPSPSKRKKKKNDRTLHASSESVIDTPENPRYFYF